MTMIRKLFSFDFLKVKKLIPYLGSEADSRFLKAVLEEPMNLLNGFLPLKYRFRPESYILLEDNEIVEIGRDVKIIKEEIEVFKEILISDVSVDGNDKCGYEHYMLKEIMEEPVLLERMLKPYLDDMSRLPDLTDYEEIHIVACGSAMYAGMIGKILLEENTKLRVVCEVASEYRYKKVNYDRKTLVILISQSGETADTIAAMRRAKMAGIATLAIVNVIGSTIARESERQIFIEAGPEIAVATTKAYMLQVAMLSLLSYKASLNYGYSDNSIIIDEIKRLPRMIREILDRRDNYIQIAKLIYKRNNVFFIGRKIDYAICMEGSLKLKEISYIHSEAYQAGELKHGTISLIDDGTPVISIITDQDIRSKTLSNVEEVKARGANCIIVTNEKLSGYDGLVVPKINSYFQPLLIVPCLQLIAYEVAKLRECDIDKPRNLAKSVTVE